MSENRLTFTRSPTMPHTRVIINNTKDEYLGYLEKMRVGAWMSWCLFLEECCYMSAGCLDEVREMVKKLNATANLPRINEERSCEE